MHYKDLRDTMSRYVMEYGEEIGIKDIISCLNGILFDLSVAKIESKRREENGARDKKDE